MGHFPIRDLGKGLNIPSIFVKQLVPRYISCLGKSVMLELR